MPNASAPSRGGDKITINFGLVSIPIHIYNGVDEEATRIVRNQFTPKGNRVSQRTFDSETGEEYTRAELIMKYTPSTGVPVELSDDEITAALGVANGESELVGVYPASEMGKYATSGPAQVRPQTQKVGTKTVRPFDKAFALFVGALHDANSFALVKYVSRGKPKLLAIAPDGRAMFLHWDNEVRAQAPLPVVEVSDKERAMASQLLKTLAKKVAPKMENESVEAVRTYAETKATGATMPVYKEKVATGDDLMAMLEASLAGK